MFGCFIQFFQILIFWVNSVVKEQKMAQNDKKIMSAALHTLVSIHHIMFFVAQV